MPRAEVAAGRVWAAPPAISRRESLPRRVRKPPQAPLRPRASPEAPPTPVHEELPRPTEVPLKPPTSAWPRSYFASKRVGSRLLRRPEKHGYSGGIFLRRLWAKTVT
jgi:hypothetical protein